MENTQEEVINLSDKYLLSTCCGVGSELTSLGSERQPCTVAKNLELWGQTLCSWVPHLASTPLNLTISKMRGKAVS